MTGGCSGVRAVESDIPPTDTETRRATIAARSLLLRMSWIMGVICRCE